MGMEEMGYCDAAEAWSPPSDEWQSAAQSLLYKHQNASLGVFLYGAWGMNAQLVLKADFASTLHARLLISCNTPLVWCMWQPAV